MVVEGGNTDTTHSQQFRAFLEYLIDCLVSKLNLKKSFLTTGEQDL